MGTRSLTVFVDDRGDEVVVMYRQYDGYPEGMGKDLAEFLDGFVIVNGFNSTDGKIANGIGCLAAQVIAHLKEGVGNIYLYPTGTRDCGEEYIYTISNNNGETLIEGVDTYSSSSWKFKGTPNELLAGLEAANAP